MIEFTLPLVIKPQSNQHACLYDAKGNYLATSRLDCAELIKAAVEAEIAKAQA